MNRKTITLFMLLALFLVGCVSVPTRAWCYGGRCYTSAQCENSIEYMIEVVYELEMNETTKEAFFTGVLITDWDPGSYGDIVQVCVYGGYLD